MTLSLLADIASAILLAAGSFFLVVGALGILRMPDVFTRMHAASVSDTLGAGFLILAMVIQAGFSLVTVKLLVILAVFFFTSPLTTHALARAALAVGIEPRLIDPQGRRRRKELGLIGEFIGTQAAEPGPDGPIRRMASGAGGTSRDSAARKPAAKTRRPARKTGKR